MGRNAKLKAGRRSKREATARDQRRRIGFEIAPCSYQHCPNNRPIGTHIFWRKDGEGHYASCDDCVQQMMQALKLAGIDAQVVTVNALEHLRSNPPHSPTDVEADHGKEEASDSNPEV